MDRGPFWKSGCEQNVLSGDGEAMAMSMAAGTTAAAAPGDTMAVSGPVTGATLRRWFVVYTCPNHEKRVAEQLRLRGIEAYLAQYRAVRRWRNGCTVSLALPLFPGYVFVHIALRERVQVLRVPSVLAMVGNGREPVPLPDQEMESLRNGLGACAPQPHPYLTAGRRARIRGGPLQGLEGIVLWKKNHSHRVRLVLTLEAIQRSIAVEVGAAELELLASG